MQLSKNMFARVSNSTTAVPISPFDIPEIFELLLFYLDSYTVRHSIALVCCQWRHMSKHRIVRTVTWHQGWGHLKKWKLLRQLPTATRFYYHHHSKSSEAHKVQNPFNKDVLQVLEENDSKYKEQLMRTGYWNEADHSDSKYRQILSKLAPVLKMTHSREFIPLRELQIYLTNCPKESPNMFYYPSSLTKLTLKVGYEHRVSCNLDTILQNCPSLEYFCAERFGVSTDAGIEISFSSQKIQRTPEHPFPLRSLVLHEALFQPQELLDLLQFVPSLKELKLTAMIWTNTDYIWTLIAQALKANNIILDKAHFSIIRYKMSSTTSRMLWSDIYPQSSSELSLWAPDITPQLLQEVLYMPNTLTSLEVFWSTPSYTTCLLAANVLPLEGASLLHKYLCDPSLLVHLVSLKTLVSLNDVDLFNRRGIFSRSRGYLEIMPNTAVDVSSPISLWSCRSLHTLHLDYYAPIPYSPGYSRLLFGYIAQVCPSLEDLQICLLKSSGRMTINYQYHYMDLQLESGLCLLSRLQYLQKLRIFEDNGLTSLWVSGFDLDWILKSGRTDTQSVITRQRVLKSWTFNLDEYHRSSAMRYREIQMRLEDQRIINSGVSSDSIQGILNCLVDQGFLVEVANTVAAIDSMEFIPFPRLERLSFRSSILLRPKEAIEQVFA